MDTARCAEIWAPALSEDGQYLAGVSQDGHIKVWDLNANCEEIQDYETKGSFGTCLDMVGHCCLIPLFGTTLADKIYSLPMAGS